MVIAHVLTSLHIGGGERVTLELASTQAQRGHRVLVVSLADAPDGPLAEAFRQRNIPVFRVAKRDGLDPTLPLRLAACFRRNKVTVAHLHNRLPLIYGVPAARLVGAIAVHTRHGPRAAGARQERLVRLAARGLHAYVAVSEEVRQLALSQNEVSAKKLSIIENGIDVDCFACLPTVRQEGRAALGIPDGAWVVGAIGRFAPEKDFPLLVRAVAPLLGPKAFLLIAGDGAEMPAVRAAVDKHGIGEFVRLPGSRSDVPRCLATMDVFVLSSRMEGLPLAVLEAMAAGLPLVASAVGGLPALITDGVNGYLFPSGDAEALRARLVTLREHPAQAASVAALGTQLVRARHSREAMTEQYLALYANLGART